MTTQDVIRQAVAELDIRENITLDASKIDIQDLVWSFNAYFGPDAAFNLKNDYVRADIHSRYDCSLFPSF